MSINSCAATFLAHLRPLSWPVVALHFASGWAVAAALAAGARGTQRLGDNMRWEPAGIVGAAMLAGIWAIFLNGGTLGLNSAIDRDTDAVGYLQRPPPPHRGQAPACIGWMLIGGAITVWLHPAVALPYGTCVVLSLLYSVPPVRLKARPGWDLAVNMVGYGALTFLAGGLAGGAADLVAWGALAGGFAALFAALYPLTQLYQLEQDRAAGVRTLALALGRRGSLDLAIGSALVAHVLLVIGLGRLGPGGAALSLIAIPAAGWAVLLGCWRIGRVQDEKRAMYWGTRLWGLADLILVLAAYVGSSTGP